MVGPPISTWFFAMVVPGGDAPPAQQPETAAGAPAYPLSSIAPERAPLLISGH